MAGALTISTLNDSSGVLATQNGMKGICKAWVNFNGITSPYAIRASFNVSSITRNSTGNYTITFTTAMPDANYVVSGSDVGGSSTGYYAFICSNATTPTTSGFGINIINDSGGLYEQAYIGVMVVGN